MVARAFQMAPTKIGGEGEYDGEDDGTDGNGEGTQP